jgi:hypothetical protein
MNPATPPLRSRKDILSDIANIPVLIEGKLCARRNTEGQTTGHKLQRWRDGKNQTRYVPENQLELVRKGTDGFQRFSALSKEYVARCEQEALHPADEAKKKPTRRSRR